MNASRPHSGLGRLLLLVPLLLVCACSSLRGRANDLAKKGRFVEAADLYEQLVRETPNDPELVAARDDLRWRGLSQLLGQARRARFEGQDEEAEANLEQFLACKARWSSKLDGALESSLLDEMENTHNHLRRLIGGPAKQGAALTAETQLNRKGALLAHPEMAPILRDMTETVVRSGHGTCERLKALPSEGGAHWAELVERYCRYWRVDAPQAPVFPEALGVPTWDVAVRGMEDNVVGYLQTRLAHVFEASPWYSPRAERPAPFALQGEFSEDRWSQQVDITAPWTEQVPYTDHEDRTAKVDVPYTVEETYVDKETQETKTRTVTKTQTVEYTTTVEVTKYRDVPRTFEYKALRRSVEYRFVLVTRAFLEGSGAPLAMKDEDSLSSSGYEHDVTFAPGGVYPQRADLPKGNAWLEQEVRGYEKAFADRLLKRWRDAYCTAPALTKEEAARCARAGQDLPASARAALADVLGDDASRVHLLFATL